MKAPLTSKEPARLASLRGYDVLDTPPEQAFDDLTLLAAQICQTPIALVSLIDEKRQWFKSKVGLGVAETSRDHAFCAHALLNPDEVLEVRDATLDPRFADNPLVTGDPNIRFYAGAPLVAPDGQALGTLCVIDRTPRRLSAEQHNALRALSRHVVTQLELRRAVAAHRQADARLQSFQIIREKAGKSSLEKTSAAAFIVAGLALLIVGGLAARSLLAFRADADWVAHTHQVITSAGDLLGDVIDVQTSLRGYIISGEERYLAPYRAGVAELPGDYEKLRTLTLDNPRQLQRVAALAPLIERRLEVAATKLEARRTSGFEAAKEVFQNDEGKAVTDQIRAEVAAIIAEEYQLLALRDRASKASGRRTLAFVGAFGGLAALLLGATSFHIRREMAGRWRAQARIEILNADLETRAMELAAAKERAEAADRLKSAFLATMSHELRTPLNSIIGFTGIMIQGLAGPLNPEQGKQLGMVQNSARHLLTLINDILDLSKIEAGELKVTRAPFDVRASITRAVGIVQPLAAKKELVLRVDVAPEVGEAVGDSRRVEQILLNLLSNAIKFTDRGEVVLAVTITSAVAPSTLSPQLSTLNFAINDTGLGIKPENMATLFQPFQQIDAGLARAHEGTGLGLVICRRLAGLMGGDIHAVSTWGKGSTFTFTLPVERP